MPDTPDDGVRRPGVPPFSPASRYADALLRAFVRLGVRHLVVCPGSRSQALALAAARLEAEGAVKLHVRIDERVAGFFALGVGSESRMPAVVITTSGTAGAHLHAAVLEADAAYVPMIAITADRPAELHGIRANQTMTQTGLYGGAVRWEGDVPAPAGGPGEEEAASKLAEAAVAAACGEETGTPGPVHLNVALREPLSGRVEPGPQGEAVPRFEGHAASTSGAATAGPGMIAESVAAAGASAMPAGRPDSHVPGVVAGRQPVTLDLGPETVVIAGHGAGPEAEDLAHRAGWPLLAEVVSGAHFGRELVVAYRELLRRPELGGRVRRAVVFGHPTLSREVPALLARHDVEVVVVAPHGVDVVNPGRRKVRAASAAELDDGAGALPDRSWLRAWITASRALLEAEEAGTRQAPDIALSRSADRHERAAFARAELAAVRAPVTRRMLVEMLWQVTWPYDRLVFAASRLVRDADKVVPGKKITVHANRGLSGIDGTIATGMGVAAASSDGSQPHPGVTRVLVGDLALLHDAGALLGTPGETPPLLQVIVGDDRGGSIFDGLEVSQTAAPADFDRVVRTPRDIDLSALATAYGWEFARATTHGELERALSGQGAVPRLIEVPLPR